ncbi:MAG: hypothetical protein ACRC57_13945 [Sarcina sp.]
MKKWSEPKALELGIEKTEKYRPTGCHCEGKNNHSHGAQVGKCDCCDGHLGTILPSFPDIENVFS